MPRKTKVSTGKAVTLAAAEEKTVRHRVPKWVLRNSDGAHPSGEQYYLRSIGRALDVLDCFDGVATLSLKEISQRVKLPESSLFRVLLTLEKHGYLSQHTDGTYELARKLVFGWLAHRADVLRELARPELEALANRFNETVSMAYLHDDRIHVLESMESFHEIRISNKPGRVLPPHCSAMGKAITAFQDRALTERILEVYGLTRRTERTITDRRRIFEQLEDVRATGVAYDREESNTGGLCIGAAIRPEGQQVVSAISISTPLVRMSAAREQEIRNAVIDSAANIAAILEQNQRNGAASSAQ